MTPQFHVAAADQGLVKNLEGQLSEAKAEVERLTKERDEARQTLSDWTADIGVRGFARRSELDAAKAEVETLTKQRDELNFQIEHLEACLATHDGDLTRQRDELKAQVDRLLAKEAARIGEALVK